MTFPSSLAYDYSMQSLSDLCGVSSQLAKSTADILFSYFKAFSPQRRVVKEMELKAVVKCFKLPSKIGNVLIGGSSFGRHDDNPGMSVQRSVSEAESEVSVGHYESVVELVLREGLSSSTILDLGQHALQTTCIYTFGNFI